MIYLDNAATTLKKPESVIAAVTEAMQNMSVNAGRGSYGLARQASHVIDECKEKVLKLAGIHAGYSVYFSASATLSINQLLRGLSYDRYTNVYVTPFEHNAVMRPLAAICKEQGCNYTVLPFVQSTWQLDMEKTESMFLQNKPSYVIASMVSNTTGYLLPISELVLLAHRFGAKVIVDCAQAFGAVAQNYEQIGADAYIFAGHKTLYGPFGVAGMILSNSFKVSPGIQGGTGSDSLSLDMPAPQYGGYEPSSPNIHAIAGLKAALGWIEQTGVAEIEKHEQELIKRLISRLQYIDKVRMYLPPQEQQKGILALNIEGYSSHDVGEILDDEFDIAVRTGYQCAPLVHDWLGSKEFSGIVRISPSYFSTESDIESLANALDTL